MYIAYQCERCKIVIIVNREDMIRMETEGRIMNCIFGHRDIRKLNQYEGLRECMEHSYYKREHGVVKQIR